MKKTILFVILASLVVAVIFLVASGFKPGLPENPTLPLVETPTPPAPATTAHRHGVTAATPPSPTPILLAQAASANSPAAPSPAAPSPAAPAATATPSPTKPHATSSTITTADEAAAFFADAKTPNDLLEKADLSNPVVREFVVARMSEMEEARYESVTEKANRLGIPIRIDGPGSKVSILHDFDGDRPIYRTTQNRNAAISSGANLLTPAPYGLNGAGVNVGVWDAGSVRDTHQEFPGNRVVKKNPTAPLDDHATHVAGTVGANGTTASAIGMAPLVAIDSYDWNNDYSEMTSSGAATASDIASRIPISNHSYGYDARTSDMGRYNSESVQTDSLALSMPYYLIFWAAGNEQDILTAKGGYQSITFNGLAKNILTVGAVNDAVTSGTRDTTKATMSTFSSWGPCDDGRIKPDLVANGVTVNSPIDTSNTAYASYSGTSMASPSAAGSAALLVQLYAREFSNQLMRASMLKALLIHTADDIGNPGPDYKNGWGLINVKAAADVILAHKASLSAPKMIEGILNNSTKTTTHSFQWDGTSPIRATLCWTDPAGTSQADNSRTPNLRHNLDLQIASPNGTTTLPFVMPFVGTWTDASMNATATRGKNTVDTVEQVLIASPGQAGTYTATVSLTGNLTAASQVYSLVITGGTAVVTNPPPSVTLDSPATGTTILPNTPVTLAATATDKTLGGANGTIQSVQFFSGNTSLGIDTTAPYSVSWTPPAPGTYSLRAMATDTEGASSNSTASTVFVLSGNGTPAITSFSPASGRAGDVVTINGTNFTGITSVAFNGIEAQFTATTTTLLAATVPAGASSGPITITNTFGNATSASSFSILQNPVLISQIYGGGGNSGAPYNSDFVEIHNRGNSTVSLSGWSIQYASAAGTSWQTVTLNSSIAPGKYHLVKLAGGSAGAALPTPDTSANINMSATQGKVALRNTATAFTGSSPLGQSGLQDLVGFGTANAYEGSAAAPSPSATTSIFRAGGGATDSGDNRADFSTGTPNPRNSAFGSLLPPAVTSPATADGTVNEPFTHQITASNSPTSFNAANLPPGLAVNISTGLVSGTPTIAGTTNATLSATNSTGSGNATLSITIAPASGGGVETNYFTGFEDGSKSGYASGNVTLTGISWNFTEALIGSDANDFKNGSKSVRLRGYSTSAITMLANKPGGIGSISFQHRRYGSDPQIEWIVEYSLNSGAAWTEAGRFTAGASTASFSATINQSGNVRARIRTSATGTSNRRANIDDYLITDAPSATTPLLTAESSLTAHSTPYGNASASSTFTVSGANITSGILVTPPAGFELSQTANGTTGYAATQTLSGNGTLGPVTLHLRLAAGTPADSYSGSIISTSQGATSVTLTVPVSTVRQKLLTVTASNRTKPFGQTLSLGASAFTSLGLVGTETIGSVTLTASGGTQAGDTVGTYEILPANATGGSFSPFNYDILYQPGTLTVTAPSFAEWSAGLSDPAPNADPDGDGIPNLLEYFLGLDPSTRSTTGIVFDSGDGVLSMDYPRSKALSGSSGGVEWTSTLTGWSTANVTDSLLTENATHETRRATVPVAPSDTKKFLRLRVTTP